MQTNEALPASLTKAGLTVTVEDASSGKNPRFIVTFPRDGKKQQRAFGNAEEARLRAETILGELLNEVFPIELGKGGITAKIYFTPTDDYDAFTLVYYREGKRKRERFGALDEARTRGRQVLDALMKGHIDAPDMTVGDRDSYFNALKYLEGTNISLESACKDIAEASRILGGVSVVQAARDYAKRHNGTVATRTVRQVVDEFLKAKREGRATRLRANGRKVSERYLYELERKLGAFAKRFHHPIGMVSSEEINKFIAGMDVEGRTKNNYIQAINVLFEFAKKQKYLPRDHEVMDEIEAAAESDFAIEIFTPDELEKLLKHAEPSLVPVLAIGAFAGLRTAETERLDWSKVNLATRLIEVKARKAKTRARRLVPITDNLAAWLTPIAEASGKVWPQSAPYLFQIQREAGKAAEVPWKHNALRHSFISYRLAMVKSVDQVAMEAGNSAQMIFQHYRELVRPADAEKWFSITPEQPANMLPMNKAVSG